MTTNKTLTAMLGERVLGQPRAIACLAQMGSELLQNRRAPNEYCIVYLGGPPGTGKTFSVRMLAECTNIPLATFDMSTIATPGEFASQLTKHHRENSGRFIGLLDEFDKTKKEIVQAMLPIESGYLVGTDGRLAMDQCLMCLTSNFDVGRLKGTRTPLDAELARRDILKHFSESFSPEFCDRIRHFVMLDALTPQCVMQVAKKLVDEEIQLQGEKMKIAILFTKGVVSLITRKGFSHSQGGCRGMRNRVRDLVRLALDGLSPTPHSTVRLAVHEDSLIVV